MDDWTAPKILDLAPDASSRKAGQRLGRAAAWLRTGWDGRLAQGEIKGSGAAPYLTALSLDMPVFKCSCPSRKFSCKHGLGLFLVLAAGAVASVDLPDWVAQWDGKRRAAVVKPASDDKPVNAKAQDRRRAQREAKVDAGVAELELWMRDLVRRGLAGAQGEPYAFWDHMATRLVDAQARPPCSGWRRPCLANLLVRCGEQVAAVAADAFEAERFSNLMRRQSLAWHGAPRADLAFDERLLANRAASPCSRAVRLPRNGWLALVGTTGWEASDYAAEIAFQNKRVPHAILSRAAADAMREIAADPRHLGAVAVLQTWGQALQHHRICPESCRAAACRGTVINAASISETPT